MTTVSVHEAKTYLSRLIARVLAGEEVVIARGKEPVVKLVPLTARKVPLLGALEGKIDLADAFFEPLPEDELAAWDGG